MVTTRGRINRIEFLGFNILLYIIAQLTALIADVIDHLDTNIITDMVISTSLFVWVILIFFGSIALVVKRLHDTNHSGWYYLITIIPLIDIIFFLYLLLAPGTEGDNQYGPKR